jgi:replicative DNA helicase
VVLSQSIRTTSERLTRLQNVVFLKVQAMSKRASFSSDQTMQEEAGHRLQFLSSKEFSRAQYPRGWLVEQILLPGQPGVIGGPRKSLKTSIGIDLAVSLSSGEPFLGRFRVPKAVRAAVISGESGGATLQDLAQRVCQAKQLTLDDCDLLWSFDLPQLGRTTHLRKLADFLSDKQIAVLIFDPLYLCLLDGNNRVSASNLFEIGPHLRHVAGVCLNAGTTPLLVHHSTKGATKRTEQETPLDLDDLAFVGVGEFVRQWILLSRRERYRPGSGEHQLLMAVGGSAGHSGCWTVHVQEGVLNATLGGRGWKVRTGLWSPPDTEDTDD